MVKQPCAAQADRPGKNRFKIGTNDKADYSKLINTKWPDTIDDKVV
ncbi:unnamed protein product, partial [Rotaria magnacalcarata]